MERALSQRRFHLSTSVLAVPVLVVCAACAGMPGFMPSSNDGSATFVQVDDLMSRVERVHVDCELASEKVREATGTLHAMCSPDFDGEPAVAHETLIAAIQASERQAEDLQRDYDRMTRSGDKVFAQWQDNLEEYSSEVMRDASAKRMNATRARYDAVVAAVGPALETYRGFNATLRDHALYIGTDFNEESLGLVEQEIRMVLRRAEAMTAEFERCKEACQTYVKKSAIRGQVTSTARKQV